ncbi:MAG: GNAT family N-acetyltransferase [Caulobacteraceae bacterium]
MAELNRLNGRALAATFSGATDMELRLTWNCALAFSGEPVADLNMVILGPDAGAEDFLVQAMARAETLRLPLLACMTPHVAAFLEATAERLGLTAAGTMPMMVFRASSPLEVRSCRIDRALGQDKARAAGDLMSAAFALPRDSVARAFESGLTATSGAETFIGFRDERPMSAVTVARAGSTAGIWCMATPPEYQGKGMGRALLTQVMERFRLDGVDRFYLLATAAGRPLYQSIGFVTLGEYSVWVRGHSTQVNA